jgi:aspartate carbamoyltransferase regulatory subunit
MALLKIESGEVTRHVGARGAFAVAEMVNLPDGRSFPKTYTVWADEAPEIGTIVSVIGVMSAKVREYQSANGLKQAVDISINEPNVTVMGVPAPAAVVADIQETLGGTEVPF